MSLVMFGFRLSRTHPKKITKGRLKIFPGKARDRGERLLTTAVVDEAYGIAAGSLFAVLWQRFGPKRSWPVIHGMLFSLGLWLLSYKGWIPGVKLMPAPERDRRGRLIAKVTSHLAYGAVLGTQARNLEKAQAERRPYNQ